MNYHGILRKTSSFFLHPSRAQHEQSTKISSNASKEVRETHKPNSLERRFLVWTGKYKSINDVPPYVAQNVMEKTRNRMRIRIANYMMAATALGCILMIYLGKKAAGRGESVTKQNLDWHKKFNEDFEKNKKQD